MVETKPTDCVLTKQRGDSAPCDITKGCYRMGPPHPPLHFLQHDHGEAYVGDLKQLLIDHSFESRGASMFFFDFLRFACLIFCLLTVASPLPDPQSLWQPQEVSPPAAAREEL